MKNFTKKMLAVILVLTLAAGMFTATAFAVPPTLEDAHHLTAEQLAELTALGEGLAEILDVELLTLTPEAKAMVLADLEYLFNIIIQVAPTQNMVYRQGELSLTEIFAMYHQIVYANIPMPATLALDVGERWATPHNDHRYLAADYLYVLLTLLAFDLGGLGHMGVQLPAVIEQLFFAMAHSMYNGVTLEEDDLYLLRSHDVSEAEIENIIQAIEQLVYLHHSAFNAPSALWFHGIDPAEFDLSADISTVGFMNPENVTTAILKPDYVAYVHIASFLNNIALDAETLFPFFEEVQDFEHLIIDLRGNLGGFTTSFPTNVIQQLIDESITFTFAEFFIASELTTDFFANPHPQAGGLLQGMFPAAEYVEDLDLPKFNSDDLELLDYVMVWQVKYVPAENNTPFNGKIWLLVDGQTASTSEKAAKFSLVTGFATVVGEPTAGVTQVTHTYVPLPYTGMIFRVDLGYTIDQYGRSIEEFGVIPQIPNAEGLDAFETLLYIISPELFEAHMEARAAANPFNQVPHRDVDGVTFVPLRLTAYAHGWAIEWDGPNNSAVLEDLQGNVWVVPVGENYVFNDNGRLFMPLEVAIQLFNS
ncbi:MAG: S41 family peptidase [Firmicutes bacterium]|nr:S41 family peptidase [Bacillota bacterium]